MNYFLAKTEPDSYSMDDLKRDTKTAWDGVRNPQAVKALRSMTAGDRVFIYHSGGQSAVVGLAEVLGPPRDDPRDSKSAVVDLKYVCHLTPGTPLAAIKNSGLFDDWALVRQGRLSTMPAPASFVTWMRKRYPNDRI